MTSYLWWEEVEPDALLMQGDVVEDCPVAVFNEDVQFNPSADVDETLKSSVGIVPTRSIVMTQACDLAEQKVRNVILCPAYTVEEFREEWERQEEARNGAKPGDARWRAYIGQIKAGRIWSLALLRKREAGEGVGVVSPTLVVDFHEIFSLPVRFLQPWLAATGKRRLRLCPPYREHLSQAFARYFMRVGLPVNIDDV